MHLLAAVTAAASEPAKGASVHDLLIGAAVGGALTLLVLWVASAHRAGRISFLSNLAGFSERVSGLPGWCALPSAVTGTSLGIAVFGFYWDVAKHIDTGRDPGPFGTAAHYPILIGLGGIALGGVLAVVLGCPREVPTSVKITRDWHAPLGGLLVLVCGIFALSGFPLDDVWHRLFGQDVTLWGPTHVLMVGGASLATLGMWVLLVEGKRARVAAGQSTGDPWLLKLRTIAAGGAFLIGLSSLQGEFDYGVPQFQQVFQPIMIMLAAGIALVAARIRIGRGGAIASVGFWLIVRGALALVIAGPLGRSTPHFPLYIAEALVVELVAARAGTDRPLRFAALSGLGIGTVGLAAEWGWSHVWMPLPWTSNLLPQGIVYGFAAAMAGAILGGLIGGALTSKTTTTTIPRGVAIGAAVVAVLCIAIPMPMTSGSPLAAAISLKPDGPGHVSATVKLSNPSTGKDAQWFTATAWQGGGSVVDRLKHVGGATWRSTEPLPVGGKWKTMLRLADGRALKALPIYLPEDTAIPAKGVPARSGTRVFVKDKQVLQREAVGGSEAMKIPAYLLLLAIVVIWLAAMTWGLKRLDASVRPPRTDRTAPPPSRVAVPA